MQKRFKFYKFLIFILTVITLILVVAAWLGQTNRTKVAVVLKSGMDTSKSVADLEKTGFIGFKDVLSTEYKDNFNNIITPADNIRIQNQYLKFPLDAGETISKGILTTKSGGNLAASIPEDFVLYFIPSDQNKPANNLPVDAAPGDRVDVIYNYQQQVEGQTQPETVSTVLLENVQIHSIVPAGQANAAPGVYLKVSKSDHLRLVNANLSGTFTLRLPGIKNTPECKGNGDLEKRLTDPTFDCHTSDDSSIHSVNSDMLKKSLDSQATTIDPATATNNSKTK